VVVAAVAACAVAVGVSARPQSRQQSVTLQLLWPTAYENAWSIMIGNFNRVYPNIKIETTFVPIANYFALLQTQLQSGSGPDLFATRPGIGQNGSVQLYAQGSYVADLSGRPWANRVLPAAKSGITYNGKTVAYSLDLLVQGLIYDRDAFARLGLKLPRNFGELLSMCQRVAATGKVPIAFPAGSITYDQVMGIARAISVVYTVNPKFNERRAGGAVTFSTSPAWRRALQSVIDMKNAGCFGPAPAATQPAQAVTQFVNGDALTIFGPSLLSGQIAALKPSLDIGVFPIPPDRQTYTVVPISANDLISANARSSHLNEAKTFIDFLARPKQNSVWSKATGTIAPWDARNGVVPPALKEDAALFKQGKIIIGPQQDWPNPSVYSVALAQGVQGLLTGQKTVAQTLQDMDRAWG
jgi:raffinose/stachyose/melibiose transport system substrate-binding protein